MTDKIIYLIRHGETGFSKTGRFFGRTDLPLSEEGRAQAQALRPWLTDRLGKETRIYSSPLRRVLSTLHAALPDAEPFIDPDLREMDFGRCEGLTFDEIRERFPDIQKTWSDFSPAFSFPGGESLERYLARIRETAARLAADSAETLIVFSHGGVIRSLLCQFLGLPAKSYAAFRLPCAGVAVVTLSDGYGTLSSLGPVA